MGYSWGGFESLVIIPRGADKLVKGNFLISPKRTNILLDYILALKITKDLINDLKKSLKFIK